MGPTFYLSDLLKLSEEYKGKVTPTNIRNILIYLKLDSLEQSREAINLYLSDESTRTTIDNFVAQHPQKDI